MKAKTHLCIITLDFVTIIRLISYLFILQSSGTNLFERHCNKATSKEGERKLRQKTGFQQDGGIEFSGEKVGIFCLKSLKIVSQLHLISKRPLKKDSVRNVKLSKTDAKLDFLVQKFFTWRQLFCFFTHVKS